MTNNLELKTPELLVQHGYSYREMIGEGSNGKTYRAQNMKTGEVVAIKALKFSDNLKNYELFKREAEVLQSLNHPGIPRFFEFITGEKEFTECWIVQEFIEGQSVLDILEERQTEGKCFSIKETLEFIYEAAEIVKMLQTDYVPPIIHRDIKPSNILIRKEKLNDFSVCLIDFGAVANPQKRSNQSTVAGTVGYMAPEQLIGDCSIQSDYYSLGATALHMLTGIMPSEFPSDGFKLQFESILKEKVPDIPPELVQFLQSLMAPKIADRPQNIEALMAQMCDMIEKINASCMAEYKRRKQKLEKYDRIYYNFGGIKPIHFLILNLIVSLFGGILITAFLKEIIRYITGYSILNGSWLFIGPILMFVAMYILRPRESKLKRLKDELQEFSIIKVRNSLPRKAVHSDIENRTPNTEGWAVVKGTISAVHDRFIEYYYPCGEGKYKAGYSVLDERTRNDLLLRGIQLKVGEKIDLKYQVVKKVKSHENKYQSVILF